MVQLFVPLTPLEIKRWKTRALKSLAKATEIHEHGVYLSSNGLVAMIMRRGIACEDLQCILYCSGRANVDKK